MQRYRERRRPREQRWAAAEEGSEQVDKNENERESERAGHIDGEEDRSKGEGMQNQRHEIWSERDRCEIEKIKRDWMADMIKSQSNMQISHADVTHMEEEAVRGRR